MLGNSLDGLYHNGLLGDYGWVEKAYKGELTRSELDVANNLILVNLNEEVSNCLLNCAGDK